MENGVRARHENKWSRLCGVKNGTKSTTTEHMTRTTAWRKRIKQVEKQTGIEEGGSRDE